MAIDKLNFTGAGYAGDFKSSQENIGDDLLQLGKYLETKKQNDLERLRQENKDKYQRDRDTLQDTRYEADKKQKADENSAISNYANQVNMYQTGNALGQAQGKEISDMADKLTASGVTGSDFDKQLNDRVNQMYSQNRTRVSANPTDALGFVKENVIVPQGVDPSKIIQINDNLENKFIRMQEKKDDLEYRREKDKEDAAFRKQQLGMQQQQLDASLQERADRLKDKKEEEKAIINTFSASSGVDDNLINSNKKTVTTDKVILDETKKEVFNKDFENIVNSDKTLNENNKVILNESSKVLNPEQKTDEALKKSWEKKYNVNKSGISNLGSSLKEELKYKYDPVDSAKSNLSEFLQTNTRDPIFGSEKQNLQYDEKLKELQDNLKKAESEKRNIKTSSVVAPSFEDYKKETLSESNAAENRIKNSVNVMENRTKELQNSLLADKSKGYSKFETKDISVPVSENTYKKRYYEEMVKNNPNMTKADQIAFMKESTLAASEFRKENALKEKEAEKAEAARIEKLGDTEKERLGLIKDRIKELRQKVLSAQDSAVPKTGYRLKGEEVNPEEYFDAISSEYAEAQAELNKALNSAEAKLNPQR